MDNSGIILIVILLVGTIAYISDYYCHKKAEMRPGNSGKNLYLIASVLSAMLAAIMIAITILVSLPPVFYLNRLPFTIFCSGYACLFTLSSASCLCKARLGARIKRCGDMIGFLHAKAFILLQQPGARKGRHPKNWLPFYQPWFLFKSWKITFAEMSAAILASAALIMLAVWVTGKINVGIALYCYICIGYGMTFIANALDYGNTSSANINAIETASHIRRGHYAWNGLFCCTYFIPQGAFLIYYTALAEQFIEEALDAGAPLEKIQQYAWLPDIGHAIIATALCCIPFFALRLYHEWQLEHAAENVTGQASTPQSALTQPLHLLYSSLFGSAGFAFSLGQFMLLHQETGALELLLTSFLLYVYAQRRKLVFFLLFHIIQPLWKNRRAWRAAYLRTRASWLLEWMMAALAPAPLLRFLSFRASPDGLERAGANASLILATFLLLPLLLRLGQKWQKSARRHCELIGGRPRT